MESVSRAGTSGPIAIRSTTTSSSVRPARSARPPRRARRRGRRPAGGRSPCAAARRAWPRSTSRDAAGAPVPFAIADAPFVADLSPPRLPAGLERQARSSRSRRRRPSFLLGGQRLGGLDRGEGALRHHRHVEADEQAGALRQRRQPGGHDLGRLADHVAAALAADGPADPRVQQPQVVVDLGRGPDRGARVADAVLLPDGDGGARCPQSNRRPASPSARGTAGRRPTATRRSGAGLRRRSCRRRATICPTRSRR